MGREPSPPVGMRVEGLVDAVRLDWEGQTCVLRLHVVVAEGRRIPVEMRGREVRGVVMAGDRIVIDGVVPGTTIRPRAIDNRSTGALVEAWSPGLARRALGLREVRAAAVSAVVTSTVGLAARVLLDSGGASRIPGAQENGTADDQAGAADIAVAIVGLAAAAIALAAAFHVIRRFRRARLAAAVLAGAAVGLALVVVLV